MKSQEPEERCLSSLPEGRIASSSTFRRTVSLQPWHRESRRLGCAISCSPSHLHPEHGRLQISLGRDHLLKDSDSLWLHEASEELRSLWALFLGGTGTLFEVPLCQHWRPRCLLPIGAAWQRRGSGGAGASRERVGVRMNNDGAAALGSCTTDSQHRNYSRHKENTNKDHTQQRKAGISQQKRRIETLKAAFISLCSSVHGQSSTRNVRAQGTPQVIRISSFIAYFLYKLTTNTGVLILFVLFGNSETE